MTHINSKKEQLAEILIHTSVKLVTKRKSGLLSLRRHFNPHEREARDETSMHKPYYSRIF